MKIGNKDVGNGRTYIIAEFGVNHNGSLERARDAIIKAAKAGADAIKFQTYTADELVVKGTPKFWKAESKVDEGLDQYQAYKALEGFKRSWYPELIRTCKSVGIEFLSTPFSKESADFLNELGMAAFKVASSDMSTLPYLRHIARYGKPIILSTGASTMDEIKRAVSVIEEEGNDQIAILHCTLCYPTKEQDANLAVIHSLRKEFPFNVIGLSDHTMGAYPAYMSIAFGAQIVEKHYTVDKTLDKSADHWLSVDPDELKEIVDNARRIEVLRGSSLKAVIVAERETRALDKRSIVTAVDIRQGELITEAMLTFKRPGTGIWPDQVDKIIGRYAKFPIKEDTIVRWEMFKK